MSADMEAKPPLLEIIGLEIAPRPGLHHRIDLILEPGQAVHIQGPSGVGKTTLLRVIARLRAADGGELKWRGRPSRDISGPQWRKKVAYLPQQAVLFDGTIAENLALPFSIPQARGPYNPKRGKMLLERVGLGDFYDRDSRRLSGGEAARVALCRALLMEPDIIMADEPLAALDPKATDACATLLQDQLRRGGALILVAHHLPELVSDRLALRPLALRPSNNWHPPEQSEAGPMNAVTAPSALETPKDPSPMGAPWEKE